MHTKRPSVVDALVGSAVVLFIACVSCGGAEPPPAISAGPTIDAKAEAKAEAELTASIAAMSPDEKQRAYQAEVDALKARGPRLTAFLDGFPKELTDLDALAGTLKTPQAAFEYVRDRIALEPYPGVMKGALGTLLTRGGNDWDRALLLAALLQHQGVNVTIAHGAISPDDAKRIAAQIAGAPDAVDRILATLPTPPAAPESDPDLRALFEQGVSRRRSDVTTTVEEMFRFLASSLKSASVTPGQDGTPKRVEALQDHHWVETKDGVKTVPYDPTFPTAQVGQRLATTSDSVDPGNVPNEAYQRLTVRVVGEYLRAGQVQATDALSKEVRAVDLLGKSIRLILEPESGSPTANHFKPILRLGDNSTEGKPIAIRASADAPAATPAPQGGSPFGGLGGGLAGVAGGPPPPAKPSGGGAVDVGVLGRVSVEITNKGPHLADVRNTRVLMDRLETTSGTPQISAALADDKAIRALLVPVWDGAIAVGPFHPLYVLRQSVATLAAQEPLEEKRAARLYLGKSVDEGDVPAPTLASDLLEFFMASDLTRHALRTKGAQHTRSYYERPRLAVVRHGFAIADWSAPGRAVRYVEGIDLVNTPFGFVGPTGESAELAMKAGIGDTALERSFSARMAPYNTLPLFGAASGQKVSTVTLRPGDASALSAVATPAAIRSVMRDDIGSGHALVAPARLVSVDGQPQYGWWSVDLQTGYAIGRMDLGGAQGLVESSEINQKITQWTETFIKFYGNVVHCYMGQLENALGSVQVTPGGVSVTINHGTDPSPSTAQVADCLIDAACDTLADLVANEMGSAAAEEEAKNIEELILNLMKDKIGGKVKDTLKGKGKDLCKGAAKNAMGGG